MNLIVLKAEESLAHKGATHVAVLKSTDLTESTANTAQTIALATVANKCLVECVEAVVKTAFQDASDAAFNTNTLIVGDGGDTDRFLASQELNVNGSIVYAKAGTGTVLQYATGDTVDAVVGSMSGKSLSNIDAGEVHIYLRIVDCSQEVAG